MRTRFLRLASLLAVLGGALTFLLLDPRDAIDTEAHWRRIVGAGGICPVPNASPIDWTIVLPDGEGGFVGLSRAVHAGVGRDCEGPECPARVRARLEPLWGERPGFFTGYGSAQVQVDVDWQRPECEGRARWRLDVTIDQGRRGREAIFTRHVGRMLGDFLAGASWSIPYETL